MGYLFGWFDSYSNGWARRLVFCSGKTTTRSVDTVLECDYNLCSVEETTYFFTAILD